MKNRVKPAVKALIERQGKILFLKAEAKSIVYWILPGGKVEYGEKPKETLKREIKEELSTEVEIGNPVGMYTFFEGRNNDRDQVVLTVFKGKIDEKKIEISENPADENIKKYQYLKPQEIIQKSSNPHLQSLIVDYYNISKYK